MRENNAGRVPKQAIGAPREDPLGRVVILTTNLQSNEAGSRRRSS
jgi:hypothetical protein